MRLRFTGEAIFTAAALAGLLVGPARAVELKPDTMATFDRYIRATEPRIAQGLRDGRFLVIDDLSEPERLLMFIVIL